MSNTSSKYNTLTCANCGKGEDNSIKLKSCTACKLVKYCSRDCQISHRSQHKKECKRRAKEIHDEKLFKQPPRPEEDACPICFLHLPFRNGGRTYMSCCGKVICCGCIHAVQSRATKVEEQICPFCRTPPASSDEERIKMYEKRMELNDAIAIYSRASDYIEGRYGLPQNRAKALELYHRAGELGCANAYSKIGGMYIHGNGVERDEKKAKHYYELGAMGGCSYARHNVGCTDEWAGNKARALKHFMIAVKNGHPNSLERIKLLYSEGHATKDDYASALRYYQAYLDEIKSDQRDEAVKCGGLSYY